MRIIFFVMILFIASTSCKENFEKTTLINLDSLIQNLGQPNQSKEICIKGYDSVDDYYFECYDVEEKGWRRFDSIEFNNSNEKVIFRLLKESKLRKLFYLGFLYIINSDSIFIRGLEAKFKIDSLNLKNFGFVINDSNNHWIKIKLPEYDLDSTLTTLLLKRIALLEYKKLIIFTEKRIEHQYYQPE